MNDGNGRRTGSRQKIILCFLAFASVASLVLVLVVIFSRWPDPDPGRGLGHDLGREKEVRNAPVEERVRPEVEPKTIVPPAPVVATNPDVLPDPILDAIQSSSNDDESGFLLHIVSRKTGEDLDEIVIYRPVGVLPGDALHPRGWRGESVVDGGKSPLVLPRTYAQDRPYWIRASGTRWRRLDLSLPEREDELVFSDLERWIVLDPGGDISVVVTGPEGMAAPVSMELRAGGHSLRRDYVPVSPGNRRSSSSDDVLIKVRGVRDEPIVIEGLPLWDFLVTAQAGRKVMAEGTGLVSVTAGEKASLLLELEMKRNERGTDPGEESFGPGRRRLDGLLILPEELAHAPAKIRILSSRLGDAKLGSGWVGRKYELARSVMTPRPGRLNELQWEVPSILPQRYSLEVSFPGADPPIIGWEAQFQVESSMKTPLTIRAPRYGTVQASVMDAATGKSLEAKELRLRPRSRLLSPAALLPADSSNYRFHAPVGSFALYFSGEYASRRITWIERLPHPSDEGSGKNTGGTDSSFWSGRGLERYLRVVPGFQSVRIWVAASRVAEQSLRVIFLDGQKEIFMPLGFWRAARIERAGGGSSGVGFKHPDEEASGQLIKIPSADTWLLHLAGIAGYERFAPQEIYVGEGEVVELRVRLVRR